MDGKGLGGGRGREARRLLPRIEMRHSNRAADVEKKG